jgi:hypothetical protein
MSFKTVVFPHPDGPKIVRNFPECKDKDILSTAFLSL